MGSSEITHSTSSRSGRRHKARCGASVRRAGAAVLPMVDLDWKAEPWPDLDVRHWLDHLTAAEAHALRGVDRVVR